MPAHVLAHGQQLAVGREQPGRVQPAGAVEHPLGFAEPVRQLREQGRRHAHLVSEKIIGRTGSQVVDACLAADAAGAGREEVPAAQRRDPGSRAQRDIGDVARGVMVVVIAVPVGADPDRGQVGRRPDDALADQEACGQVDVIARCSHGQRERLAADPDLNDYYMRLTLLRLKPTGQEGLKAYGYDLFEGVPSTFAPVTDIQVPVDYIVGPGDQLEIQLYGNEPADYELTVERDGRINFPKLGPIMVSGMTFDQAREAIEHRVSKQLTGARVSVTMGDLREIRVFVLGEAKKPGSYTVSGLSTMTNALFVSGGVKKIGSLRNIQLKRDGRLVSREHIVDGGVDAFPDTLLKLFRGENAGKLILAVE